MIRTPTSFDMRDAYIELCTDGSLEDLYLHCDGHLPRQGDDIVLRWPSGGPCYVDLKCTKVQFMDTWQCVIIQISEIEWPEDEVEFHSLYASLLSSGWITFDNLLER